MDVSDRSEWRAVSHHPEPRVVKRPQRACGRAMLLLSVTHPSLSRWPWRGPISLPWQGPFDYQSRMHFGESGRSTSRRRSRAASGFWPEFAVGGARSAGETADLRKRSPGRWMGVSRGGRRSAPWKGCPGGAEINNQSITVLICQKVNNKVPGGQK